MRNFLALTCAAGLALASMGCAGRTPSDVIAGDRISTLREHLSSGDLQRAVATCEEATRNRSAPTRTFAKQILADESLLHSLRALVVSQSAAPGSPDEALGVASCRENMLALGLIDDEFALARARDLNEAAQKGNREGSLAFLATHDIALIPALSSTEAQDIIVDRSIDFLRASPSEQDAYQRSRVVVSLMEAVAQPTAPDAWKENLGRALPEIQLTIPQLRGTVSSLYPDYAAKTIQENTTPTWLEVRPRDLLLLHDLKSRLARHPDINFVDDQEGARLRLIVEKLQVDEIDEPERTQTITYASHQVNLLAAVLLMPKYASYLFDHTTGGASIEFAFELSATVEAGESSAKLIRDRIERTYTICSNARIQNAFGGVQPANFRANAHMEQLCSESRDRLHARDLRGEVLDRLVREIESLATFPAGEFSTPSSPPVSCLAKAHEIQDPVQRDEALSVCIRDS